MCRLKSVVYCFCLLGNLIYRPFFIVSEIKRESSAIGLPRTPAFIMD